MRGTKIHEAKIDNWKDKAKERRLEKEQLKRRVKELGSSRDNWRLKYRVAKEEISMLKKLIKSVDKCKDEKTDKPKHHSYNTHIIMLVLYLRQQGLCSLRCCSKMLLVLNVVLGLRMKFPCANTIRNWEAKHGIYRLQQAPQEGSEWMLIIDESIGIGKQKLLLILGVEVGKYKFGEAPTLNEVSVLDMSISESWKWEKMQDRIEHLKLRGFDIKYGVSDGGASVVKSLSEAGIQRIADCTHVFGNLLKTRYKNSELFKQYSSACKQLRQQLFIGKNTHIMPPTQRVKGKYLNLWPLAKWGLQVLDLLERKKNGLTELQHEKLMKIKEYEPLIKEMGDLCKTLNSLLAILKNKGLCPSTKIECQCIVNESKIPEEIKERVLDYLQKYCIEIEGLQRLICCSDIIESTFGKYKRTLDNSTKRQINDTCLFIANYGGNFSLQETKMAMEQVRIVDLAKWKEENTVITLTKRKQDLFQNTG